MITITSILGFLWGGGALMGWIVRFGVVPLLASAGPIMQGVLKVFDVALEALIWTAKALWIAVGVFFEKPMQLLPLMVAVFLSGAMYSGDWKPWHIGRAAPKAAVTSPQKTKPAPAAKRSEDSALGDFICNLSGTCK